MSDTTIQVTLVQQHDYRFDIHFGGDVPVLTGDEPAPLGAGLGPGIDHAAADVEDRPLRARQQLDEAALVRGVEVEDDDQRELEVGRERGEQLGDGLDPPGGGADAGDARREQRGRARRRRGGAGIFSVDGHRGKRTVGGTMATRNVELRPPRLTPSALRRQPTDLWGRRSEIR